MTSNYDRLRPATVGDIPGPYVVAYDDLNGDNLSLAGFTATVTFRIDDGTPTTRAAQVNPTESTVAVTWQAGDHATAGVLKGEVTAMDGSTAVWQRPFMRVVMPRPSGT